MPNPYGHLPHAILLIGIQRYTPRVKPPLLLATEYQALHP